MKDLPRVPTRRLEVDSNPQPSGCKAPNIPLHHRAPRGGLFITVWISALRSTVDLPQIRLHHLEGVLWVAARLIGGVPKFGHISAIMRDVLHWLPVQQRIHYRVSSIVWHCVLGRAPVYLRELFTLTSACSGRRSLRSASRGDFMVPHARSATRQRRAFSIVGPSLWNGLPSDLRSLPRDLSGSFYKLLKTFLFDRAWFGSTSE